ncbi:MAG: energy-coupling factor transport system permease protein [Clostridiales bacterium]|nr:energy-coupling factor transport system permease protein [Clostridiales bacterium]
MNAGIKPRANPLHIDPRTKLLLLFTIGSVIFTDVSKEREVLILVGLAGILLLEHQYLALLQYMSVFLVMLLVDVLIAPRIEGIAGAFVLTIARIPRLLLPLFICSTIVIRTTSVSEFIAAFQKMHVSNRLIIPFSVMFRFVPTIKEEWHSIRNAMKLRGIGASWGNLVRYPLMTLEYALVPLLMSTATISGELAAASLSRGLDSEGKRSCITPVCLGVIDYIILLLLVFLLLYTYMR